MTEKADAQERAKKPAVMATLRDIVSGRMIVSQDGHNGYLEEYDGRQVIDPENGRKLIVAGVITLIKAGYLTEFCAVTDAGRAALHTGGQDQ